MTTFGLACTTQPNGCDRSVLSSRSVDRWCLVGPLADVFRTITEGASTGVPRRDRPSPDHWRTLASGRMRRTCGVARLRRCRRGFVCSRPPSCQIRAYGAGRILSGALRCRDRATREGRPAPRIGRVDPGARSRSAGPQVDGSRGPRGECRHSRRGTSLSPQALPHSEVKGRLPDRAARLAFPHPQEAAKSHK
jgi:hypothetical protein